MTTHTGRTTGSAPDESSWSFPNLANPEVARVLEAQQQHHRNDDGKIIPVNKFCRLAKCGMALVRSDYTNPESPLVCGWDPRHPQE